jgi:hypothetical protein
MRAKARRIVVAWLACACVSVAYVAELSAQVDTTPLDRQSATFECGDFQRTASMAVPADTRMPDGVMLNSCDYVQALTDRQARGELRRLRGLATEILQTLKGTSLGQYLGNLDRNLYRLIWVGAERGAAPVARTIIVKPGDLERTYDTLPGVTETSRARLIEVFLHADPLAVLDSRYISTRGQDPLLSQIGTFVERTRIVDFLAGIIGVRGDQGALTYTVATAPLPFARASVKIRDTVVVPGTSRSLRTASEQARDQLRIREARSSACAQTLADAQTKSIADGLQEAVCVVRPDADRLERSSQATACRDRLVALLRESYANTVKSCKDGAPAGAADPVIMVDTRFNDLVKVLDEKRYTADSSVTNTPLTRLSFGTTAGAILGDPSYSGSTMRAKVGSNGVIIQDPLPSVITMAIVNIHPWGYDPASVEISPAERFRFFAGTALTPDFGIGGGAAALIVRGLSANIGWANLFVKTPGEGLRVGDAATAAQTTPLQYGSAGVLFAGLSYVFK